MASAYFDVMKKAVVRFVKSLPGTIFTGAGAIRIGAPVRVREGLAIAWPVLSPDVNDLDDVRGNEIILARPLLADNRPLFSAAGTKTFAFPAVRARFQQPEAECPLVFDHLSFARAT